MPQGKVKAKAKLPDSVKRKQKNKASAFTRRANAPIKPKKSKFTELNKIKQVISKTVNKSVEEEIRGRAVAGKSKLSNAQKAVEKHHHNSEQSSTGATSSK